MGSIKISAFHADRPINTETVRDITGMRAVYSDQPASSYEERIGFLTSILAGHEGIDIYILQLDIPISIAMRNQKGYVSLGSSESVNKYLESSFEWVENSAKTDDGDIWMLPLRIDVPVLWYVEDNFNHFDLAAEGIDTFDGYYETIKNLNEIKGNYTSHLPFFNTVQSMWFKQYEMHYNDYKNGKVNFETDIFRDYFAKKWDGWELYSDMSLPEGNHPVFNVDYEYITHFNSYMDLKEYNSDNVVVKIDYLYQHMEAVGDTIGEWRALPMPTISDEVTKNYMGCEIAVINPFSENKELAVEYLSAVAENIHSVVEVPLFALEDLAGYENRYDLSLPVSSDINDIFRNGETTYNTFPTGDLSLLFVEYQQGLVTLDEAVSEIQRRVEFWLNE